MRRRCWTRLRHGFAAGVAAVTVIALPYTRVLAQTAGATAAASPAQQLLFLRGGTLYQAASAGQSPGHREFTLGSGGDRSESVCLTWAAASDGRRVIWMTRGGNGSTGSGATDVAATDAGSGTGLRARPAILYVSDLSGRHRKKLLETNALRDRLGRPVGALGIDDATGSLDDWEPVSVSWSSDCRTVYVSCLALTGEGGKATFAADAASGAVVVDGQDRWRSIAPATAINARGRLLVGSGFAHFSSAAAAGMAAATPAASITAPTGGNNASAPTPGAGPTPTVPTALPAALRYGPLLLVNLAEGTRTPLYAAPASTAPADLPAYAFATDPALSPDGSRIAFATVDRGLWVVDWKTRTYHQLVEGAIRTPHWTADGKSLYFLLPRPGTAGKTETTDLYAVDVPTIFPDADADAPVRLVLQNLDGFHLVRE